MTIERLYVEGPEMPDGINPLDKVVVFREQGRAALLTTKQSIADDAMPVLRDEAETMLQDVTEKCSGDECAARISEYAGYAPEASCFVRAMGVTCVSTCAAGIRTEI